MTEEQSVRVNFGRPIPLFPLHDVVLLPQQVMPLHVFEERYRDMISDVLDGAGQIAMAVFEGDAWKQQYHGRPPIKPAVCIGQLVQHEAIPDGRYNILLQGVCRARVVREIDPIETGTLYRQALLEPVGVDADGMSTMAEDELESLRTWVDESMSTGPLRHLTVADQVLEYVRNDAVPTPAVIELISFATLTDSATRYRMLAEGDLSERVTILRHGLERLSSMLRIAETQGSEAWPKGLSWN